MTGTLSTSTRTLAGLAGALQLPREPAHLQMDVNVVVETFVVVVTGGLGSIGGAFAAAMLIGVIHALGLNFFPQATLVLVFLTMAVVLVWRPQGLAGSTAHTEQRESVPVFSLWPVGFGGRAVFVALFVGLTLLAWGQGDYGRSLAEDVMVMMLFGLSLQWMMALGGLVSFGHAAFFALGANEQGSVVFNNAMRIKGNNNQFFKNENSLKTAPTSTFEKHRIWLNLSNSKGLFKHCNNWIWVLCTSCHAGINCIQVISG